MAIFNPNRSQLQYECDYCPPCPRDKNGQHCRHFDTHDSCCDCDISIDDEGNIIPPTTGGVPLSTHERKVIMDEIMGVIMDQIMGTTDYQL